MLKSSFLIITFLIIIIMIGVIHFAIPLGISSSLKKVTATFAKSGAPIVSSSSNDSQIIEERKSSIANILYRYCKTITTDPKKNYRMKKTYNYCNAVTGSGFFLTKDGYIVTNAHVVNAPNVEDIVNGFGVRESQMSDFTKDLIVDSLFKNKIKFSDIDNTGSVFKKLIAAYLEYEADGTITTSITQQKILVNFTDTPFDISKDELTSENFGAYVKNASTFSNAEMIGMNFGNMFSKEVLVNDESPKGSDVAILKLSDPKGYTYPYLTLANASPKEGQSVIIFGFPGLVSGDTKHSIIDYVASSTHVSITRGIVSSMKKDSDGHNLIQTDASIDYGNSGGPGIDLNGEVIGISTYQFGGTGGNYNFLRDIADVKALAAQQNIPLPLQESEVIVLWRSALKDVNQHRYLQALQSLTQITTLYPPHKETQGLIETAKKEFIAGNDRDYLFGVNKNILYSVGLFLAAISTVSLFLFVRYFRNSRKHVPDILSS